MSLQGWTIETPVAPWSVVVDGDVVVASGFTRAGRPRLLACPTLTVERAAASGPVADAVRAYLAGDVEALDAVAVTPTGWRRSSRRSGARCGDPAGADLELRRAGDQGGAPDRDPRGRARRAPGTWWRRSCRATGWSGPTGRSGGYAYGLPVKRWLLAHEAVAWRR